MAMMTKSKAERAGYLKLVNRFDLRPIRTDDALDEALEIVRDLMGRHDLDAGERDYLDVLAALVSRYEEERYPMPRVSDAAMLRHLIEARGVTQSKLASDVGIPMSTISEFLSGKRKMARHHVKTLAAYFGVGESVFQL